MFNLKINRFVDERRNIIKSTEAAALYYKDLYNIFGSWELAWLLIIKVKMELLGELDEEILEIIINYVK